MQRRKYKYDETTNKLLKGIRIARQKMLEEKSLRNEYVIYYDEGKIKRESAKEILRREGNKKKN